LITVSTDRSREGSPRANANHSWDEFRQVYPIYSALARQRDLPDGPYTAVEKASPWADQKTRERDLLWLDEVDRQVLAVHIRQFLITPAAAREEGLRVFLQRLLLNPQKEISDRDKIDLLVVQYFVLRAPQSLIGAQIGFSDVAQILAPVLGEVEATTLDCCEPFERILESAQQCRSLRDLVEQGLMEQGRLVKEAAGGMFYDPAALVSICRFNFILRRIFIQLLHGDLRAIGAALNELERRNFKTVDCRRAGLSALETIARLRGFHQRWKTPFQTDYSQGSSLRVYEQLMCLREDLEETLGGKAVTAAPLSASVSKSKPAETKVATPAEPATPTDKPLAGTPASTTSKEAVSPRETKIPNVGAAEVDNFEERIWEQLIATPPVRGRSMTTVTVEGTRVLLSAWEVAAFISASGQDSDDLRRVIVARAMLSAAIERRKRILDFRILQQAVAHARLEIPRFQERIDHLKRTLKTDSAVNLGISVKRLLALVEEAEQLQKGSASPEEK
jgi:hypothetical protein